jgi:hypothetical protein
MTHPRRVIRALLITAAFASLLDPPNAPAQDKSSSAMAVLTSRIDTKAAKIGDVVYAETTEKTRLHGGAEIPQGAKLIGVITDVTPMKNGNGMSMLELKFQQIVVKHGPPITIHGGLLAVAPPAIASGELPLGSTTVPPGGLASMSSEGHKDDDGPHIPAGSTVDGIAISTTMGSDGATELQGNHVEVRLPRGARLQVALL